MYNKDHIPVMLNDIELFIKTNHIKTALDCTFGAGGHSYMMLQNQISVVAIDQDPISITYLDNFKHYIDQGKLNFHQDKFSNYEKYVTQVDFILADLGLSSMQINSDRGFSFMSDSKLDMSMNIQDSNRLIELINTGKPDLLLYIIKNYGEEKSAQLIVKNLTQYRIHHKIESTMELRKAIKNDHFSVLARIFQAFRIYINNEITELECLLKNIHTHCKYINILTYHSIEEKIVKKYLTALWADYQIILPSEAEIIYNNKSRSAKLHVAIL